MNKQLETYLTIFNRLDFEKIIDHPNILIAANFWDEDRFLAAKTCYKFMRAIDDLIDNYKSEHKEISEGERELFEFKVKEEREPQSSGVPSLRITTYFLQLSSFPEISTYFPALTTKNGGLRRASFNSGQSFSSSSDAKGSDTALMVSPALTIPFRMVAMVR